jgi:hypothetical protein
MKNVCASLQRETILIPVRITGGATPIVAEGNNLVTVARSLQGEYVVTFTRQNPALGSNPVGFARLPVVLATATGTTVARQATVKAVTNTNVTINIADNSGVLQDGDFNLLIIGFDTANEG